MSGMSMGGPPLAPLGSSGLLPLLLWGVSIGFLQGFLHCAGMCGPFVMAYSLALPDKSGRAAAIRAFVAHNVGRMTAFAFLGMLAGLIGSYANVEAQAKGIQAVAGLVGGSLMVLWAIDEFRTGHGGGFLERWSLLRLRPVQNAMRGLFAREDPLGAFLAGGLVGLHPCGLLFAMLLSAAATGSPTSGGMTMLAFGVGTVPALLGVAAAGWYGRKRLRGRFFSYVAGALILISGVLFALRGMVVNGWIPHVNMWLF